MTTWVDEDRVLGTVMPQMFQTGWPVLAELVQNSFRAKATAIHIERRGATDGQGEYLAIHDNGPGLSHPDDLENLFVVGRSGFEEDPTVAGAEPAGMGLYSLIASCGRLRITSGRPTTHGTHPSEGHFSVEIESKRWFADQDYRDTLFNRIEHDKPDNQGGLSIEAFDVRDMPDAKGLLSKAAELGVYARTIEVTFNGERIEPFRAEDWFRHQVDVEGHTVFWGYRMGNDHGRGEYPPYMREVPRGRMIISWYGHLIHFQDHELHDMWGNSLPMNKDERIMVVVDSGTPFHPRLPDRSELRKDEDWKVFKEALKKAIAEQVCAMGADFLCSEEGVMYACFLKHYCPEHYGDYSPVAVYKRIDEWHVTHWGNSEWRTKTQVVPVEQKVYMLQADEALAVVTPEGKQYALGPKREDEGLRLADDLADDSLQFDVGENSAMIGLIIRRHHDRPDLFEYEPNERQPLGACMIRPDKVVLRIKEEHIKRVDRGWGVVWAEEARLVVDYEDGTEVKMVVPQAVFRSSEWFQPGDSTLLYIGEQIEGITFFDEILCRPDDEHPRWEQEEDLAQQLQALCSDFNKRLPLRRVLGKDIVSRVLGDPEGIVSIYFNRNAHEQTAVVRVKKKKSYIEERFKDTATAILAEDDEEITGEFNIE